MLLIGAGKVVGAREVLFGTHIQVVVARCIQYGVDARLAWNNEPYSIYVEGNNLTAHHYVDYGNVVQPGCWVTAGIKLTLGAFSSDGINK